MLFPKLTYFVKTVECESFTKASKELFVSQSTISKSIKNLEENLKVKLIERNYNSFTLTKQGRIVYEFAKDIIGNYEMKRSQMLDKLANSDDTVRLGLPPAAGSIYFFAKILEFHKKHPDINLEIIEKNGPIIIDKLLKDKIDIGVVNNPFNDDRFNIREVFRSEYVLLVSDKHRLSNFKSINLKELANERFLHVTSKFMAHDILIKKCEEAGFKPNIVFESKEWDLLLAMVQENDGVAILPKPWVNQHRLENVCAIKLEKPSIPWRLMLIFLKDKIITDSMNSFLELFGKEYC